MRELYNYFGKLAEHLVAPKIARRFREIGYHFDASRKDYKICDEQGKELTQIDFLLENGEYIIAVEVKSTPAVKDVVHHLRRLEILRDHRRKKGDTRILRGAIAGAMYAGDVKQATIEAGLYVIEQSGDTMKMDIPEGFTPRDW